MAGANIIDDNIFVFPSHQRTTRLETTETSSTDHEYTCQLEHENADLRNLLAEPNLELYLLRRPSWWWHIVNAAYQRKLTSQCGPGS